MTTTNGTGTLVATTELHRGSSRSTCGAARHGTHTAYDVDDCRCPDARADHATYERRRATEALLGRPRRIDATGSTRRIHALIAIGWDTDTLAWHLGWTDGQAVRRITRAHYIFRTTADRITRLYDALADHPGPSTRARRHAARQGWLSPLWWDADTIDDPTYVPHTRETPPAKTDIDPVRVDRAIAGQRLTLTRAERLEAVRQLRARRLGYDAIADRLGVAGRQVHRDLTDLGLVRAEAGAA